MTKGDGKYLTHCVTNTETAMKSIIFLVLISVISISAFADDVTNGTGNQLQTFCNNENASSGNVSWYACVMYVDGVLDGFTQAAGMAFAEMKKNANSITEAAYANLLMNACIPPDVTRNQIALVVTKYLGDHPAKLNDASPTLVLDAISNAWPCGSQIKN